MTNLTRPCWELPRLKNDQPNFRGDNELHQGGVNGPKPHGDVSGIRLLDTNFLSPPPATPLRLTNYNSHAHSSDRKKKKPPWKSFAIKPSLLFLQGTSAEKSLLKV